MKSNTIKSDIPFQKLLKKHQSEYYTK